MTIELKDVVFSYPETPDKSVLNIQSWRVSSHQRVFVHGPSGGGKSTLLNVLSGIIRPVVGELMMLSQRLDQMTNRQLDRFRANHIGYIFQQFNLIPYLNAVDNIRLANQFSKTIPQAANIIDLLMTFGLDETDRDRPTEKLSIGQQQRIAIARALINKPEILIADEPTSSLDKTNRDVFMSELHAMVSETKTTLLFVSHDLSLSDSFDRVDSLADINTAERAH
jgi:putative ABC transport system ATP-binding protein